MTRHVSVRHATTAALSVAWFLLTLAPLFAQPAPDHHPVPPPAEAAAGRALFVGAVPLANGGPACISCHSVSSLPFPYGGTVGPDLTHVSAKLGPEGLRYAMETLYFPTMTALFRTRPLKSDEQAQLGAFLQLVNEAPPPRKATVGLGLAGLAGCLVLLVVTARVGRGRVRSVRHRMLARAKEGRL